MQRRLRALGYEIERRKSGQPEIKGYTREYLEAGSPRRRKIQEYLTKEDRRGAAASQIAEHQTRAAKAELSHEQVVEAARGGTQYAFSKLEERVQSAVTFATDRNKSLAPTVGFLS